MVASSRVNNNVHLVFFALAGVQPLCRQRVRVLSFAEQRATERLERGNVSNPRSEVLPIGQIISRKKRRYSIFTSVVLAIP